MRGVGARGGLALVAVTSVLLVACSTSPESLEKVVRDKAGVIEVEARENDSDEDLTFGKVAKHMEILMGSDASAAQIMTVFDAYDDYIDDGDVGSVKVALKSPKQATLSVGLDVHATRAMVDDLVEAQRDDDIIEYRREAGATVPSVGITLAAADYQGVVAVADRYRDVEDVDLVQVTSGDFLLIRDAVNADPDREAARERFALDVNRRFRLTGAVVTGRTALRFSVARGDKSDLQDYVERHASARVGKVIVGS